MLAEGPGLEIDLRIVRVAQLHLAKIVISWLLSLNFVRMPEDVASHRFKPSKTVRSEVKASRPVSVGLAPAAICVQ